MLKFGDGWLGAMVGCADGWILEFDNAGFGAGNADFDAR